MFIFQLRLINEDGAEIECADSIEYEGSSDDVCLETEDLVEAIKLLNQMLLDSIPSIDWL